MAQTDSTSCLLFCRSADKKFKEQKVLTKGLLTKATNELDELDDDTRANFLVRKEVSRIAHARVTRRNKRGLTSLFAAGPDDRE